MHIQPRGYKRFPRGSSFTDKLDKAVEQEMKRFNVSRSFVIAVATAEGLGVKLDFDYKTFRPLKLVKGRRKSA